MTLLDPLFGAEAVQRIFSDRSRLQRMLDFEATLASAEARASVIPKSAVAAIQDKCRAELFDLNALAQSAVAAGNLAIPMVKQLTALVGEDDEKAAGFVHWGATSQDVIDTGLILQVSDALDLIEKDLSELRAVLAGLVRQHRDTPVAARTWMQHAVPTSFGLQVAGWLDAVQRHQARLREMTARVLVLQFGGAAGTLAALGDRGLEVSGILADELRLTLPEMPWHAHRDRMAEVATAMALCAGTLGKIGRDIALQMQTEVGELSERFTDGSGGSSTMPQKRNPVSAGVAISAAVRVPGLTSTMLSAMVQEHERGLGGWHAEWDTLPQIIQLTAGSLHHLTKTLKSLESKPERMLENLKRSRGLIFAENAMMAVAKHVGRSAAHQIVTVASHRSAEERRHLGDILKEDSTVTKHLSAAEIDHLFDPLHYIGMAQRFIDRVLVAHEEFSRSRERG